MLRIGYMRLQGERTGDEAGRLRAAGCHVVRAEEAGALSGASDAVLGSILEFIGAGDQLVVASLGQLGPSSRAILEMLDRLEARGASLQVLEPELSSQGASGRALRAALVAVASVEPALPSRRRRPHAGAQEILSLQRAGVGPVEIARRLGVSRMTVWRKLKAVEAQA